jgi:hypothetical protein
MSVKSSDYILYIFYTKENFERAQTSRFIRQWFSFEQFMNSIFTCNLEWWHSFWNLKSSLQKFSSFFEILKKLSSVYRLTWIFMTYYWEQKKISLFEFKYFINTPQTYKLCVCLPLSIGSSNYQLSTCVFFCNWHSKSWDLIWHRSKKIFDDFFLQNYT